MKPEDFRQLLVTPGTLLGLIGDYGGPSDWSHHQLLKGLLESYLVLERHHNTDRDNSDIVWDAAATLTLMAPLDTVGFHSERYIGTELLLIQRLPIFAWDSNDPI